LPNEELAKYEKYFNEIEDLEYQAVQLKKPKVDTLDLELEIKLTKSKTKSGQFQMADMYLESLRPKAQGSWAKIGSPPMHLVKKKIAGEEVTEGIRKAQKERVKYIKKNPQQSISFDQELLNLKKGLEEKKKRGKDTSKIEMKFDVLKNKLAPLKGKPILAKDAVGIKKEVNDLKKQIDSL